MSPETPSFFFLSFVLLQLFVITKPSVEPAIVAPFALFALASCATASFLVWRHEAFGLWKQWQGLHAPGSASSKIIGEVADSYYLVNVVDNDFINGNIFTFLDCALAKAGK